MPLTGAERNRRYRVRIRQAWQWCRSLFRRKPQGTEQMRRAVEHAEMRRYAAARESGVRPAPRPLAPTPPALPADVENVSELRAMPYTEYLASGHWAMVRQGALRRAANRCQVCSSPQPSEGGERGALHCHHNTYVNLGCEMPEDLCVLCAECHQLFHDNAQPVWRGLPREVDRNA